MSEENKAYPIEYLSDFIKSVAAVFVKIGKSPCNVEKVLNRFLASTIFEEVHTRGNFLYLNKSPRQLLECLTYDEEYDYLKELPDTSSLYEPDILYWTAEVLVRFQWYYNIDFREWLKYFSTQDVYDMFYPGHEASYQHMIELLKEKYDSKSHKDTKTLFFI